nr:nucleotidyltransferase domain-containing protein [Umezawaea beigongshangensis]
MARERGKPERPAAATPATTILSTVVGSHAYGLATTASDVDRRGVFVVPAERFWRFDEPPASREGPRPEELNWELGRFCELALRSNPTVLEVFVSDRVEVMTPLGEELRALLPHVLSRRVAQSYLRATSAQITRARAAEGTRWKQVMHSLRLLIVCRDLLRDGVLSIDASEHRERLLAVRAGQLGWPEVLAWADGLRAEIDRTEGPLPEEPGTAVVEDWLVSVRRRTLEVTG